MGYTIPPLNSPEPSQRAILRLEMRARLMGLIPEASR